MGKIYCTECGEELNDTVKFCSSCGTKLNNDNQNNNVVTNDDSIDNFMEKIETTPLLIGIAIVVVFHLLGIFTGNFTVLFAITIAPFVVGYLSNESIKIVMSYAILLAFVSVILYYMFPNGFIHIEGILIIFVFMFLFTFIGNFIKSKSKQ